MIKHYLLSFIDVDIFLHYIYTYYLNLYIIFRVIIKENSLKRINQLNEKDEICKSDRFVANCNRECKNCLLLRSDICDLQAACQIHDIPRRCRFIFIDKLHGYG